MKAQSRWLFTSIGISLIALLTAPPTSRADILYVADSYTQTIKRFDLATGTDLGVFATTNSGLSNPAGLALDSAGNLYVANRGKNNILKFTSAGVGSVFATNGVTAPYGLAFDKAGNLYVSNEKFTILKFTPDGVGTVFVDQMVAGQEGLTFDSAGNLFLLTWNSGIRKYTPAGVGSMFAANPWGLLGLAFDSAGTLYVGCGSDILKMTSSGTKSTFATSNRGACNDFAFDSAGNLWAAQSYRIARFTPGGVESELCGYPSVVTPVGVAIKRSSNNVPSADVIFYSINKTQHLWQGDVGFPVERPYSSPAGRHYAWHTRAQVFFSSRINVVSAYVGPTGAQPSEELVLSDDGLCLEYLDDQPTQASMDASVPEGTYTIQINTTHDGTRTADLTLSGSDYPVAPHILNFDALQGVNPAADWTLSWDAIPGATSSDYILVGLIDPNGQTVFHTPLPNQSGVLRGTNVSAVVPAGTLAPNTSYIGYVAASKVQNTYTSPYPGVLGFSWYGRITEFLVNATGSGSSTPPLRASLSAGKIVLSWPTSATGVVLQTSTTLATESTWQPISNGIATVGSNFVFTNNTSSSSGFFRLFRP